VIATVPVGEYPEGIAGHPDDHQVWVANWFDNTVTVLDAESLRVRKTITVGDGARAFGEFISLGAPRSSASSESPFLR
jgi:YVTN family beta-propeller protein